MKSLIIMACSATKGRLASPAIDLYQGVMYSTFRANVPAIWPAVVILSAKHGFIESGRVIAPYEQLMTETRAGEMVAGLPAFDSIEWPDGVRSILLAGGKTYRKVMLAAIERRKALGLLDSDVIIEQTSGGIGYQRAQLGAYLRNLTQGSNRTKQKLKLTEAQVFTLRRMMTGTKYQLRGDAKKAIENRPSIEAKRGQWFHPIDPVNAPSVPVLYRLGLVDFTINHGQEPTKYYNVRLTDKGQKALMPENAMTKAPEQRDPRSLNAMKEAVPATSQIQMRVTPGRKKRYVNQARAEGMKLSDWIQKHMDDVCDNAGQPDE
ncbi:hypothetical protein VU643_22490 [Klebsiella aerogenes]|uniref:DUF6884 domain-containing protein n=1 Tax=Klebsiella aerogenes TaxID=548 RepID=UPI003CEA1B58